MSDYFSRLLAVSGIGIAQEQAPWPAQPGPPLEIIEEISLAAVEEPAVPDTLPEPRAEAFGPEEAEPAVDAVRGPRGRELADAPNPRQVAPAEPIPGPLRGTDAAAVPPSLPEALPAILPDDASVPAPAPVERQSPPEPDSPLVAARRDPARQPPAPAPETRVQAAPAAAPAVVPRAERRPPYAPDEFPGPAVDTPPPASTPLSRRDEARVNPSVPAPRPAPAAPLRNPELPLPAAAAARPQAAVRRSQPDAHAESVAADPRPSAPAPVPTAESKPISAHPSAPTVEFPRGPGIEEYTLSIGAIHVTIETPRPPAEPAAPPRERPRPPKSDGSFLASERRYLRPW